jgi:hypothetical protein
MKAYLLMMSNGTILVRMRAESEDGDAVGDIVEEVHPGEVWEGMTYDELRARAPGVIEV